MKYLWTIPCLMFFVFGCDRQSPVAQCDTSQVFVSVGDRLITAQSVSNSVMILARIREMRTRKQLDPRQFPYWANATAMKMIPALLTAERMDMMIVSNGVSQTERADAAVLGRYNRILNKSYRSFRELAESFGALSEPFRRQISRESRLEAFFSADRRFDVTARDVTKYYQSYSNGVESAKNYNAAAIAKATNACERLKKGEAWSVVAKETTDDGRDECDSGSARFYEHWEDLQLKNSPYPEVAAAVARLKPGEWTDPIESAEGVVIARLNEMDPASGAYKCARILIQLAIAPEEIPTESLTSHLLAKKRQQYQFSIREDLLEAYPATFPLGTNFTYKIWAEPKQLKKGFNRL